MPPSRPVCTGTSMYSKTRRLGRLDDAIEQRQRRRDLRARQPIGRWCRPRSAGTSRIPVCARLAACLDCPSGATPAQLALAAPPRDAARSARFRVESRCCSTASVRQSHRGTAWWPPPIRWPRRPARRVLGNGGNAFDAAAATAAALERRRALYVGPRGPGPGDLLHRLGTARAIAQFHEPYPAQIPARQLNRREQVLRGRWPSARPAISPAGARWWPPTAPRNCLNSLRPRSPSPRDGFGLIEFNVEEMGGATSELRGHAALYPEWSANLSRGPERRAADAGRRAE